MDALKKYKFTGFSESKYVASEFELKHITVTPQQYARVAGEYRQRLPDYEQREFRDQSGMWYCRKREELAARQYFQISQPLRYQNFGYLETRGLEPLKMTDFSSQAHALQAKDASWKSPAVLAACRRRLYPADVRNMVVVHLQ